MSNKKSNTNYDILDKILADSDRSQFGPNGRPVKPNGVEYTPDELAQIDKGLDDIEKYLRS